MKPTLKAPGTKRLKLRYDQLLSSVAFEFNLRRYNMGAEAGLPNAMFKLGHLLDAVEGVAAPDYPAAIGWYRRAADGGNGRAVQVDPVKPKLKLPGTKRLKP